VVIADIKHPICIARKRELLGDKRAEAPRTRVAYRAHIINLFRIPACGDKYIHVPTIFYIISPVKYPDDTGAEQTGEMKADVSIGDKVASGSIRTVKGEYATGYISPPIPDTDYPYNHSRYPKNWRTSTIKITKDTTAKIKSVEFTPFNLHTTGAAVSRSVGNGVSAAYSNSAARRLTCFSEPAADA
jgi:hypothetical protein